MDLLQALRQSIKISYKVVWLRHLIHYLQNFTSERSVSNSCHNFLFCQFTLHSHEIILFYRYTKYVKLMHTDSSR
jgi:hypothetical protein